MICRRLRKSIVTGVCLLLLSSCSVAPTQMVWRPWTRVLESEIAMVPGSSVSISVTGTSGPLIGDESLLWNEIATDLEVLLGRRGFAVASKDADYSIELQYRMDRRELLRSEYQGRQYATSAFLANSSSGATTHYGLGAAVASALAYSSSNTSSTVKMSQWTETVYTNVLSLQCKNQKSDVIWKGESTWDSDIPDSREGIAYALRLITASLPRNESAIVVPKISSGREEDFIALNVYDAAFSSPALPYPVRFINYSTPGTFPIEKSSLYAAAGFLDLAKYAENALPDNKMSWKDPLNRSIWKNVTVGGRYQVGDSKVPCYLMMELSGKMEGYYVTHAWIATEEDIASYSLNMSAWQERLNDFFNVYE